MNGWYEFGPFRLSPTERLLVRGERIVPLAPKAFDMLLLLVEHNGHLLTKEEMLKALWPNTFVEEANLHQYISAVRRALGEKEGGEQYIETVPKAGYRFVAVGHSAPAVIAEIAVSPAQHARRSRIRSVLLMGTAAVVGCLVLLIAGQPKSKAGSAEAIRSIAVLPLVNLSADPAQEYLSDGLTDELITQLAQIGTLHVISRTSVIGYKNAPKKVRDIGRELQVESVIEGTVERARDRIRIRIQLINTSTDQHLWAESYDREDKDVLQLESEMAREIAHRVGQLQNTPPTTARNHVVPNEAHEHYLMGRYRWNQRNEAGLRAAIGHFQSAIELDPLYARPYAGLADSYLMLTNWGFIDSSDGYPRAKAAARRALELDERLAEAHTSLAYATLLYDWDWMGSEAGFRRAIELNPNYATAHHFYSVYLMSAGRHSEAQREIRLARELDPLSLIINSVVGWVYYQGRDYDKALEQCRRTVEMDSKYSPSLLDLGSVYLARGEHEKALELFQRAREASGDSATVLSYLAQGYALSGNKAAATKVLEQLQKRFVSSWELGLIHAALGNREQALAFLEKAADQRAAWIVLAGTDARLDSVRGEPRFRQLEARIRFPQVAEPAGR